MRKGIKNIIFYTCLAPVWVIVMTLILLKYMKLAERLAEKFVTWGIK